MGNTTKNMTPETSAARANAMNSVEIGIKEQNYNAMNSFSLCAIANAIVYLADVMYKNGRHAD